MEISWFPALPAAVCPSSAWTDTIDDGGIRGKAHLIRCVFLPTNQKSVSIEQDPDLA